MNPIRFAFLMAVVFSVIAFAFSGCAGDLQIDYMPNQDKAVSVATAEHGMSLGAAPPIEWIRGDRLTCESASGPGWTYPGQGCIDGLYRTASLLDGAAVIQLADWPGQTWDNSALAHELCHVRDGDRNHAGRCFNDPGLTDGRSGDALRATRALSALGAIHEIAYCDVDVTLEWCGNDTDDFICTMANGEQLSGCQQPGDHRRICVTECKAAP